MTGSNASALRAARAALCTVSMLLAPLLAGAAEFGRLEVGQDLAETPVEVGRFSFSVPQGTWRVAAKEERDTGAQAGNSGTPRQLSLALVALRARSAPVLLFVRAPASTYVGMLRWADDPCRDFKGATIFDPLRQSFGMPECLAVLPVSADSLTAATWGVRFEAAQWLQQSGIALPPKLWRVYYTKYSAGDFVHIDAYFPEPPGGSLAAIENWARTMAVEAQLTVTRSRPAAAIPRLP